MDFRKINGIRMKTINAIGQIEKEERRLLQKYTKRVEDEFTEVCETEITKFYSSYTPRSYARYGDLYNTYKIKINKYTGEFIVHFDSTYMQYPHRADNETIFENSFMRGYHGGAIDGNNPNFPHPSPGTPYWKDPFITWDRGFQGWLEPAAQSSPPYTNIVKGFKTKKQEIQKDLEVEFEKTMLDIINPIKEDINKLLKGG